MADIRCFRNDAIAKVTGAAKYTADLKAYGMLHAVPVYTEYVHAKIQDINIDLALQVNGVVKIITAKDVPGTASFGQIYKDYAMLASDKIRSHGDVVAIVVAKSRKQALEAAKKVVVDVQELEPILDPVAAMDENSPLVHEAKGTNIINHHKVRHGDVENGFRDAAYILEESFVTQFVEHAYLETEGALAIPRHDGVVEVHAGVQHPFTARRFVAAILGFELARVEIIGTPLGGGFGGKDDTASIVCARTALAAYLTGRSVKMVYDREWSIRESYKRHPYKAHYKMAVNSKGKITAIKCHVVADGGAYTSTTPFVTWRSAVQCSGPYNVPNVYCDIYGVHTNNVFTGAMRGFGSPQINFMVEQLVEIAAEKLGITATEFRKLNMLQQGDRTITGQKLYNHTVSLDEVMTKTLTAIDYENRVKNCSYGGQSEELYGIGYAISYRGMSLGAEGLDFCSAIINCQFDGSILLEVGVHENGQGAQTAMILLLSEHLGVNKERIRYRRPSTSNIPDGGPSVASRCTLMGGGAVVRAVEILKKKITKILSEKFNCNSEEIVFKNDHVYIPQEMKLSWDDVMQEMFMHKTYPYAFGTFQAPSVDWDEESGQGNAYFTWVYGCDAVELTVNKKTGKVKLLNYVTTHDVGKAVNRPMLLGQYYGGVAQGCGYALLEDLNIEAGKIKNSNLHRYKIPRATDIPDIQGIVVENLDANSPSGAKGIGEPALELAAPAIANAIYRATGKRFYELPIKVEGEK